MNASPSDQRLLLDLQTLDAALDRLAARRRDLPALAVIAAAEAELTRLGEEVVGWQTAVADHARAQAKLEADVDQVRARAARDAQRLDAGAVGSARELENLQSEIASLGRRQSVLEDDVLAVMEQREAAEARLAAVAAQEREVRARLAAATVERDSGYAEIDAEVAATGSRRAALAPRIPPALLARYERLRLDRGGVGAAALVRHRCEGCHLELSGAELAAVRDAPEDDVLYCEQCGRILVRLPESGLG